MNADEPIDPFAHLHDESYARAYSTDWVGAESLYDIGGRDTVSLDGTWRVTLDPFEEGLRQKWFLLDDAEPSQWRLPRDYDPGGGNDVPVPSCWNVLKPEWLHFEGAVWYRRSFQFRPAGTRTILHFGAANYAARVFLNGAFLGAHRGGSTPFCFEATSALRDGTNVLMVHVENKRRDDRVPMSHFDWFNYGGLHRGICLLPLPETAIRRYSLTLAPSGGLRLSVELDRAADGPGNVEIPALGIARTFEVLDGKATLDIDAAPRLWSPENPYLYDVSVSFAADQVRERIGFRTISVRDGEILLNGRRLILKGVCVHEDDLSTGRCSDEADIRRRFAHVRELGGNFLRLAHYPHDERVARLADEVGLLLWSEVAVYWAIDFANPETYADAENQLRELIARDANRASVIIWGVGNENADTDLRYRFMAGLARAARKADPTRLVSAACLINRTTFRIEDRLAAELDVIGLNEYFGWYEPDMSDLERLLENSNPGKPLLISETGADALAGVHNGEHAMFSEERQAQYFRDQISVLRRFRYVSGIAVWLLYDFRSERRQTRYQRGYNRKGLIAEDKCTRKLAFSVLRLEFQSWT